MTAVALDAEALAADGLTWLLGVAAQTPEGLVWPEYLEAGEPDPTLYSGAAGIVIALLEAHRHFGQDRYAAAAISGARAIAATAQTLQPCSLYDGLAGLAVALHAVAEQLGDRRAGQAARAALARVRAAFDGERWAPQFDLIGGNAGIALGALCAGDIDLAVLAVTPYLRTAQITRAGVSWESTAGLKSRRHHISHGTLGIACALAATAQATGRADLLELAVAGADDVVARNVADGSGFLVPHSDPQEEPALVDRYSYGWCHGPAGDAQVFRLLHQVTGDMRWSALQDRCWHSIVESGLPQRIRPGFWDNSGRCCGTAGVLALACDRAVESGAGLEFAAVLVADLAARATVDAAGARWSNHEHRAAPSELPPHTGWGMGSAGIIRELLRFSRAGTGDPAYAVAWPDQPPVRPSAAP